MDGDTALEVDLRTLERRWMHITEVPETPRSVMDVIEYSLGSRRKAEVYVNRLLAYFLDPEEPHGIGPEFLRAVLDGLPEACGFEEDLHDLSDVVVDDQVDVERVEDGTSMSSGIVDLFIAVPNEWFLMIELKFSAPDTQTEFYFREATHVDGTPKEDYESGTYYLYLHPHDRPRANEPNFANYTWKALSNDVLEPFIVDNGSRYPQRTVSQLREFNDDVKNITSMTDQRQNEQEKIELYLEHYESISDVSETFDDRWEDFTDEWGVMLGESLERKGLATYGDRDEDVLVLELESGDPSHRSWSVRTSSSDWGQIFKDGWWRHLDDLGGELYARPDDRNDVRIGFHHRLGRNKDVAIGERTLKFYFRCMGANDQAFIDAFADAFADRRDSIEDLLPPIADVTGNKRDKIVATYDIDAESGVQFFDAYVDALAEAFVDFVIDNPELISLIDDVYDESLRNVYEW